MSTITSTPSVAETLLTSFRATDRKHDLRTNEGKSWKALATNPDLNVVVGLTDYLEERPCYDGETTTYKTVTVTYEALLVSTRTDLVSIREIAEAYLREVAPNRTIRDDNYNEHTIPNTVRVNLEWVVLETPIGSYWSGKSGVHAHKVASYSIDTDTNQLVEVVEVIDANHHWRVNPFPVSDWQRNDDGVSNLKRPESLLSAVVQKRESIAEGERRGQLINEVTEAGIANASYKFTTSRQSLEKFIAKFNAPKDDKPVHESYRVSNAFDLASDTAVVVLAEHFLKVLGKTTWQVNSHIISDRHFRGADDEKRPVFIDEVYAYAIVVEQFADRHDGIHASVKGEILSKFTRLIHNW